ncbi:MAG: mechanosensitive ion channel family protein [bacterium]
MLWREVIRELSARLWSAERLAGLAIKAGQVLAIVAGAWFLSLVVRRLLGRLLSGHSRLAQKPSARTAMTVLRSLVYYVFFFVALVMVLRVLGVDFTAILAGAGVVGLAVGFGSQALVRDFLAGFFLLFEDAVNVGDYIVAGEVRGTVEFIGIRRTQVRSYDGTLHTIPNGELTRFGNMNRDFMRAMVTVDIAYEQDAEKGMAVAREAADRWYAEHGDVALSPPEVQGLLNLGESGLTIRVVVTVRPMRQWSVERELRLLLKSAFDKAGVEIPFPRRVVYRRDV